MNINQIARGVSAGMAPLPVPRIPQITLPELPKDTWGYLMENPSIPTLYVELRREGQTDRLLVEPETLEWVMSVDGADMLKFTVPDPQYLLIDHPMLVEDFKTEVIFRYGYNNLMSDKALMRFFRQRPEFPESGAVKTTIVCYDLSIFLNFSIPGRTLAGAEAVSAKDIVLANVKDANEAFGLDLKVNFGDWDPETKFYRVPRAHGPIIQHLAYIRSNAKVKGGADQTECEVYVENDILHFHPPQRREEPQGAWAYYAEHPGSRLLSFEPQVVLEHSVKEVRTEDVDVDTGNAVESVSDGRSGESRPVTSRHGTSGTTGSTVTHASSRAGDSRSEAEPKRVVKEYTVTGEEGNNLMGILEQFPGANYQEFIQENGIDPENYELKKDQVLKVPVPTPDTVVVTPESEALSQAELLKLESRALNASAAVLGNPRIRAGWPADFFNVGEKWRGRWYVREVTHQFDSGGYKSNMTLTREGFAFGDGLDLATTSAKVNDEPIAPKDATDRSRKPVALTNAADGKVQENVRR
jgi:hypothetical protein